MITPTTIEKKLLSEKRITLDYDQNTWKEEYGPYFKTILLFLTGKCNLNCPKCFNQLNMLSKTSMNFDFIKNLVLNNPEVDKYDIMGGEPMLHPQINQILHFLDDQEKKIGLYTNGLLLKRVPHDIKNLKINMAFHSIFSDDPSEKPISNIITEIQKISEIYPLKIVYLLTQKNKNDLFNFANYIEEHLPLLKKITIGQVRDELDYYNDNAENIIPLEEYASIIQNFVNSYKGRLNIDIFSEGILETDTFPISQENQINRFRSVLPTEEYVDCLYSVALTQRKKFDVNTPLPFPALKKCPLTKRNRCITDKIKLKHING